MAIVNKINSAASSVSSVSAPSITVSTGIKKEFAIENDSKHLLEVKFTLRQPAVRGKNAAICTLIGKSAVAGNIYLNTMDPDGSLFLTAWMRPPVWNKETGAPSFDSNGQLVKSDVNATMITRVASNPQAQAMATKLAPLDASIRMELYKTMNVDAGLAAQVETLITTGGADTRKALPGPAVSALLNTVIGHDNVKVKFTLRDGFVKIADYISGIDWSEKPELSLVVRFALLREVNSSSDLKELTKGKDQGAYTYADGTPVSFQEVSIAPVYMAVVNGAERTKDMSKIVPDDVIEAGIAAALKAADEQGDKPVFMDMKILEARAARVNAWKGTLQAATGKKSYKDAFMADLLEAAKSGDTKKMEEILSAIENVEKEGNHPHIKEGSRAKFERVAQEEAAKYQAAPQAKKEEAQPIEEAANATKVIANLAVDLSLCSEEEEEVAPTPVSVAVPEIDFASLLNGFTIEDGGIED